MSIEQAKEAIKTGNINIEQILATSKQSHSVCKYESSKHLLRNKLAPHISNDGNASKIIVDKKQNFVLYRRNSLPLVEENEKCLTSNESENIDADIIHPMARLISKPIKIKNIVEPQIITKNESKNIKRVHTNKTSSVKKLPEKEIDHIETQAINKKPHKVGNKSFQSPKPDKIISTKKVQTQNNNVISFPIKYKSFLFQGEQMKVDDSIHPSDYFQSAKDAQKKSISINEFNGLFFKQIENQLRPCQAMEKKANQA